MESAGFGIEKGAGLGEALSAGQKERIWLPGKGCLPWSMRILRVLVPSVVGWDEDIAW